MNKKIKRREPVAVHRMVESPKAEVKIDKVEEPVTQSVRPEIVFDWSFQIPCGGAR